MGSPQKVVIPKGLINPRETTIVEIPKNLQNVATVVARPKKVHKFPSYSYPSSTTSGSPSPGNKLVKKRSYVRRTFPPTVAPNTEWAYEGGATFGGRPYEEDSSHGFHPYEPDSSSEMGSYGLFLRTFQAPGMSTLQSLDDEEGSLYRDFRPPAKSSRPGSPARTPRSLKRYDSAAGSPLGQTGSLNQADMAFRKSSPGASLPGQMSSQTEITEESSYSYTQSSPADGSPGGFTELTSSSCPCPSSSSPSYQPASSPSSRATGSSGAYRRYGSSGTSGSGRQITQSDLMSSLGQLESSELQKIMGDLSSFQSARRKLVYDASSLASAADVSNNLLANSV